MVLNGSALNGTRAGAIWVLIEKGKLQREYYIQNNSLTEISTWGLLRLRSTASPIIDHIRSTRD